MQTLEQALAAGKAPRGRRPLRDAIRAAVRAGNHRGAADGNALLARVELRHGKPHAALRPARAAVRHARRAGGPISEFLALTAETLLHAGQATAALKMAREAHDSAASPAERAAALCRMARAAWAAGDTPAALVTAEEAAETGDPAAGLLLHGLLVRVGCGTTAEFYLTQAMRRGAHPELEVQLLLERGHARMLLGRPDRAARDFRAAWRLSQGCLDERLGARAVVLLAAVENHRAVSESNPARGARAASLAGRAGRLVRRLRDPHLTGLWERTAVWPPPSTLPATPLAAARALRELAERTDSLAFAEACGAEFPRLASLPAGVPAYAFEPLPL
jgi:tetratricopeptide (TPR) repeat protein